mmetsp:Transcript_28284/g.84682  ORF Transcript_28284/g.84682 Transcript_28284/m.84682 type:complete len:191 (-) Transcript_28284:22-594(-)
MLRAAAALLIGVAAALSPGALDLSTTARHLAKTFRDCEKETCDVEALDRFAGGAFAAFEAGHSTEVLLMEIDLHEESRPADHGRRRDFLRTVRLTLQYLDARAARRLARAPRVLTEYRSPRDVLSGDATPPEDSDLARRVVSVVAEAEEHGLDFHRRLTRAGADEYESLVLLTLQAWYCREGEENEPGAT